MTAEALAQLTDRSLSFSARCDLALSILYETDTDLARERTPSSAQKAPSLLFPRRYQYIFDWLTGSLLKLARTDAPRPEVFLDSKMWQLMGIFGNRLAALEDEAQGSDLCNRPAKRRRVNVSATSAAIGYSLAFDEDLFVIKTPLLPIFQVSLQLACESAMEDCAVLNAMGSCMAHFLQQTAVSMPVTFVQVCDFLKALKLLIGKTPRSSVLAQFKETLVKIFGLACAVLVQIVLGTANYKKTYPQLVAFQFELTQDVDPAIEPAVVELMTRCLFGVEEYVDEFLALLLSAPFEELLKPETSLAAFEKIVPKTATFQRQLFTSLLQLKNFSLFPFLFEAFLQGCQHRMSREAGFNMFIFLSKPLSLSPDSTDLTAAFSVLGQLIESIQLRGNQVYQQRNDATFVKHSAVLERILQAALAVPQSSGVYRLLSSLTMLNFYMVIEHLPAVLGKATNCSDSKQAGLAAFVDATVAQAALANQLPEAVRILLDSGYVPSPELAGHFAQLCRSIPVVNLNALMQSLMNRACLVEDQEPSVIALTLLQAAVQCIDRLVPGTIFDTNAYLRCQELLHSAGERLTRKASHKPKKYGPQLALVIDTLVALLRWTPIQEAVHARLLDPSSRAEASSVGWLELLLVLHCKWPTPKVSEHCEQRLQSLSPDENREYYPLILKYLPDVARYLTQSFMKSFLSWLISEKSDLFMYMLCEQAVFFEILPAQKCLFDLLLETIKDGEASTLSLAVRALKLMPGDYFPDDTVISIIKLLLKQANFDASLLLHLLLADGSRRTHRLVSALMASKTRGKLLSWFATNECAMRFLGRAFGKADEDVICELIAKAASHSKLSLPFLAALVEKAEFRKSKSVGKALNELFAAGIRLDDLEALGSVVEWLLAGDCPVDLLQQLDSLLDAFGEADSLLARAQIFALKLQLASKTNADSQRALLGQSIAMIRSCSVNDVEPLKLISCGLAEVLKQQPPKAVVQFLDSLLLPGSMSALALVLQLCASLLQCSSLTSDVFAWVCEHLSVLTASLSLQRYPLSLLLSLLRVFSGLKRLGEWSDELVERILVVARKCHSRAYELKQLQGARSSSSASGVLKSLEVIRDIIDHHKKRIAHCPTLTVFVVVLFSELLETVQSPGAEDEEEMLVLTRAIGQLVSLRRGSLHGFLLTPLLLRFVNLIAAEGLSTAHRPVKMAIQALLQHILAHKETSAGYLQLMISMLVPGERERIVLRAVVDEYFKFHRYTGQV